MRTWAFLALLAAPALLVAPAEGASHEVHVATLDGIITKGTAAYVQDAIDDAEAAGVPLVLLLETPGGLVDATLDIHKSILRARIPVMTFVGPVGAEAASAGTIILLMGHPAGMAPQTQIGSAQPITTSPDGESKAAGDKVENFLVERMHQIAERTGRNASLAERFITENLNMGAQDALDAGLIDSVSQDVETFIRDMHGREAIVGDSGSVVLDTRNARVRHVEPGVLPQTLDILGNPQVAFVLFMVGLYGLIFGLTNPGTYVPETIGALALLLALIGFGLFDQRTAGLLLMLLAIVFFVAEAFTPTNGLLTIVGVVALVAAAIMVLDEPLLPRGFIQVFRWTAITMAVVSGAVAGFAAWLAAQTRGIPVAQAAGTSGTAITDISPHGKVMVGGEIWSATAAEAIAKGQAVEVTGRQGLRITVAPAPSSDEEE